VAYTVPYYTWCVLTCVHPLYFVWPSMRTAALVQSPPELRHAARFRRCALVVCAGLGFGV
jgi:hypothetical protein